MNNTESYQNMLPDNYSINDLLGFSDYSHVLSEIILSSETPITIGIFGRWGCGKTSLLHMIKNNLDDKEQFTHHTVWFNAWKYEQHEVLWRAFILRVLDSLRPRDKSGKTLDVEKLNKQQKQMVEELNRLEDNLYQPVEWKDVGNWVVDWTKAIPATISTASNIALSFAPGGKPLMDILGLAYKDIVGEDNLSIANTFHRQVQEYRREQLRSIEQFEKHFSELLQKYLIAHNKRLIIFIDDLDRCLPEKTIEILEAIKLFLDVNGCIFVCALDRDAIEKAFDTKYHSIGNQVSVDINGEEYLEKMIQVPFFLPPIDKSNISQFLHSTSDDLPYSVVSVFSLGIQANPRKLKRAVNLYKVLKSIAKIRFSENTQGTQDTLLAKIVTIQMRSKELFKDICNYPMLLPSLEKYLKSNLLDSDEPSQGKIRSSIWDKYTQSTEYSYLSDLLTWGEISQDFFENLSSTELERYIFLSRTISSNGQENFATEDSVLLSDIFSGDPVKIQSIMAYIKTSNHIEMFKRHLEKKFMDRADITKAFSAGIALGYLDSPKDLDELCQIPDERYEIILNGEKRKINHHSFRISKYPVTNRQYSEFIAAGGYHERKLWTDLGWKAKVRSGWEFTEYWRDPRFNQPNQPVVGISLYEALAFAAWKNKSLPTSTQWQIAAGGKTGHLYPWGNEFQHSKANTIESNIQCTSPVNMFADGGSDFGVLDMSGNIWEWTTQEHSLGGFILHGGSWSDPHSLATSFYSFRDSPDKRENNLGFRLCAQE